MAIEYDFKKLPRSSGSGEESERIFPQVVTLKTISFAELVDEIEQATSYTAGDLRGMMAAVAQYAAMHLNASEHVELEGLGTLSVSIACNKDDEGRTPVITSPRQVKPHHLHVSRVNLVAKPSFIKQLKGPFVRSKNRFPSNAERDVPMPAERRTLLMEHLEAHGCISISTYMQLTHLSRYHASIELKAFAAEGIIKRYGTSTHSVYIKA
jgi:Bacterial DNA-binding protein.